MNLFKNSNNADLKTPIESGPIRKLSSQHKYQPYTVEDKEQLGKMPIKLPTDSINDESSYLLSITYSMRMKSDLMVIYDVSSYMFREPVDFIMRNNKGIEKQNASRSSVLPSYSTFEG